MRERLAEQQLELTRGELAAAYEMATRITAERDAARRALAEAERRERELREAAAVLLSRSPFFVSINHGYDDIETCQFCSEDGAHAADCPWLALVLAAARRRPSPWTEGRR